MRVSFHQIRAPFNLPSEPPAWASEVPRWYQLDAYAFLLTDLFYQAKPDFDYLVLSSPGASNETDFQFVASGAESAQRFVHTLPNIRAAMAMQSIQKVAQFCCLQDGSSTLFSGLQEFFHLCQEGKNGAWASVHILPNDDASQDWTCYEALLISEDEKGPWELHFDTENTKEISDSKFIESLNKTRSIVALGPFTLEKVN